MKATRTAVMMAGVCTLIFSACKKSDYMSPDGPAGTVQTTSNAKTSDNSNASLMFKSGMINTTSLTVQADGRYMADAGGLRHWDLNAPLMQSGLMLKAGSYDNMVTTLRMAANDETPFIHLTGLVVVTTDGDQKMARTVDFILNTPDQLVANSGPIKLTDNTSLTDLLNLKLDRLGDNIPKEMWDRAMRENPYTITVSMQSNPELYQLLLNNLETMLQANATVTTNGPRHPVEFQPVQPFSPPAPAPVSIAGR